MKRFVIVLLFVIVGFVVGQTVDYNTQVKNTPIPGDGLIIVQQKGQPSTIQLETFAPPAVPVSSTAAGTYGMWTTDQNYFYLCVQTGNPGKWIRVAKDSTW